MTSSKINQAKPATVYPVTETRYEASSCTTSVPVSSPLLQQPHRSSPSTTRYPRKKTPGHPSRGRQSLPLPTEAAPERSKSKSESRLLPPEAGRTATAALRRLLPTLPPPSPPTVSVAEPPRSRRRRGRGAFASDHDRLHHRCRRDLHHHRHQRWKRRTSRNQSRRCCHGCE